MVSNNTSHCFISWSWIEGGSTTAKDEYCRSLAKYGHSVTLIARGHGDSYEPQVNLKIIPVNDARPDSEKISHISFYFRVIKHLYENKYDFVDIFISPGISIFPIVLFFKKTKWVMHLRSSAVQGGVSAVIRNLLRRIESMFFNYIAVIDRGIAHNMYFSKAKIASMAEFPCGVNKDLFNLVEVHDESILNLIKEKTVFTYVGKLDKSRCGVNLIDAYKLVVDKCKDTMLFVVGDGDDLDEMKNKAKELGIADIISFVGRVPYTEVPVYLSVTDIALSYIPVTVMYDHQPPLKVLEYLQYKIPQVATKTSATRKYIKHEINGLIASDKVDEYALQMIRLANDKNLYESIKNRLNDQSIDYSWDTVVKDKLIPFYDEKLQMN